MNEQRNSELKDTIVELACNIDDMTAEALGFAMEEILQAGAMDVFTQAIQMKKNRPATLLTVLCHEEQKSELLRVIFKNTTTLGIREKLMQRYILQRDFSVVETPLGKVHKKTAAGYGTQRAKYEYDDLVKIAKEHDLSLQEAQTVVLKADLASD